jgi:uncharacterized RDD family membrane protein YckC
VGTPASGARRVAAFVVDYAIILVYIGFLTGLGILLRAAVNLPLPTDATDTTKVLGHTVSFLGLTLPVTLYFALTEASSIQATLGKRAVGLRVVAVNGRRLPRGRSLLRSAVKFAPWELAHTAIWHTSGQPFVSPPDAWGIAAYVVSLAAAAWYVAALFIGDRRTPYDRAAGSIVVGER